MFLHNHHCFMHQTKNTKLRNSGTRMDILRLACLHWGPYRRGVLPVVSWHVVTLLLPELTLQGTPSCAGQGVLRMGSSICLEMLSDELTPASLHFHPKSPPVPWSEWACLFSLPMTAQQNLECSLHTSLQCFLLRLHRASLLTLLYKAPLILITLFPERCGVRALQAVPGLDTML